MIELFVEKRIGALEYGMFAYEVYAELSVTAEIMVLFEIRFFEFSDIGMFAHEAYAGH